MLIYAKNIYFNRNQGRHNYNVLFTILITSIVSIRVLRQFSFLSFFSSSDYWNVFFVFLMLRAPVFREKVEFYFLRVNINVFYGPIVVSKMIRKKNKTLPFYRIIYILNVITHIVGLLKFTLNVQIICINQSFWKPTKNRQKKLQKSRTHNIN